jgi:hypothetical protein
MVPGGGVAYKRLGRRRRRRTAPPARLKAPHFFLQQTFAEMSAIHSCSLATGLHKALDQSKDFAVLTEPVKAHKNTSAPGAWLRQKSCQEISCSRLWWY